MNPNHLALYSKEIEITVRLSDVDLAGHVHNSKYLDYFESGRMAFLGEFIPEEHDWTVHGLILARNELDYLTPLRLNDQVNIEVSCSSIGNKSFTLEYVLRIIRGSERIPCCKGKSVMVCFDYQKKQTIGIPEEWRQELEKRQ